MSEMDIRKIDTLSLIFRNNSSAKNGIFFKLLKLRKIFDNTHQNDNVE